MEYIHPVRTSRGEMPDHVAYYILINPVPNEDLISYILSAEGIGEAAPLSGLSPEDPENMESLMQETCELLNSGATIECINHVLTPAIRFAVETAQKDYQNNGKRKIYINGFSSGKLKLAINGLIWMNDLESMEQEGLDKISQGFDTLKFKVGAHDFDAECRLIERFRKKYSAWNLTIRLDANGAFARDEAIEKMKELSRFEIHSIEQPVRPGQTDIIQQLCLEGRIPVALDEELIGQNPFDGGEQLLKEISPAYIILKPTLCGGLSGADAWVRVARKLQVGWWATSALESNIGLNAVAQWTAQYENHLPQGLGTGKLYKNNIPLAITTTGPFIHSHFED